MSPRDEVWITGVGLASPLGCDLAQFTDSLLQGRCGIRRVSKMPAAGLPSQIAAELTEIPRPEVIPLEEWQTLAPLEQLALWCAVQALQQADLWHQRDRLRIGLVCGLGAEWPYFWERHWFATHSVGQKCEIPHPQEPAAIGKETSCGSDIPTPASPLASDSAQAEVPREPLVQRLARRLGLRGPTITLAAACASGNYALGLARNWIRTRRLDLCLAGACDLPVTPLAMSCFGNLRALSRRNDQPQAACRPFDRRRDGFVMGEGGAMFVLESSSSARRRGAQPLAAIIGFGATSDASHLVIPNSDPAPAAEAMRRALADAQLAPDAIDYLNAHAPGTPVGDRCETRVIHLALGEAAKRIPVSSTKSMTGHAVTAASALEAAACLGALQRQMIPPTINLDEPDPECALCHVPHQARPARLRIVASNSFGFGGANTTLLLRRVA
jgi:3-oxoacyl-[acyl-carrier-protein] synthase II